LFFVHRSNDVKVLDEARAVKSVVSIAVPETSTTGLDMLALTDSDDIIVRTLWDQQILWVAADSSYTRSTRVAGIPAGTSPTAIHWDARVGLLAAFADGSVMCAAKGEPLKPWSSAGPLIAGFAATPDYLYAVPAGNAPGFLRFDWNGSLVEHNTDYPELASLSAAAADTRGVFMADFYSGKVHLLTPSGLEPFAENLANPTALAIDADGNLFVGCLEGDSIYRVFP
jgi:hypothetical protein